MPAESLDVAEAAPELGATTETINTTTHDTGPLGGERVEGTLDSVIAKETQQQTNVDPNRVSESSEQADEADDLFDKLTSSAEEVSDKANKVPVSTAKKESATPSNKVEPAKEVPAAVEAKKEESTTKKDSKFRIDYKNNKLTSANEATSAKSTAAAATSSQQQQPFTRNLDGLDPETAHAFKNMSKEAYAKLRPVYDEYNKIKPEVEQLRQRAQEVESRRLPESYAQHEQAFLLHPKFQEGWKEAERLSYEVNYWTEQLKLIEAGEDWEPLASYDPKSGQYYKGQPTKADIDAKIFVQRQMQAAEGYRQKAVGQVQNIQQVHKQLHQQSLSQLQTLEKELFPFYAEENNPHAEVIKKGYDVLPPAFRNSPMASIIAKGYSVIEDLRAQLEEREAELAGYRQGAAKQEVAKAGPTNGTVAAASTMQQQTQEDAMFDKFLQLTGQ